MCESIFHFFLVIDSFFWSYIGFSLVVICGLYFTFKSKFFQFRALGHCRQNIKDLHHSSKGQSQGVHPLKLYFASVGGMVGLGNMVGVITALLIGGPGALFWLWIAAFCGMLIKYAEIYLGVRYRIPNQQGGYDGGPMYYLQAAFHNRYIPIIVSILLCIYGIEVFQFVVITDTLVTILQWDRYLVSILLLIFTLYTVLGGVNRLATVCSVLMPIFIIAYIVMCLWVLGHYFTSISSILYNVFHSAFNGHAAVGGFAGSTCMLAAQQGIARAVYSGDIGIGYDSTIQAETRTLHPEKQAKMAIFALLTDSIICTMSMLVVLVTDVWSIAPTMQASEYVAKALSLHFNYTGIFIAIFFFIAGFTTIVAFFAVGIKCALFLSPRWGKKIYISYAVLAFLFFSIFNFDQTQVMLIMSLSGGFLMLFNLSGIIKLRKQIIFE